MFDKGKNVHPVHEYTFERQNIFFFFFCNSFEHILISCFSVFVMSSVAQLLFSSVFNVTSQWWHIRVSLLLRNPLPLFGDTWLSREHASPKFVISMISTSLCACLNVLMDFYLIFWCKLIQLILICFAHILLIHCIFHGNATACWLFSNCLRLVVGILPQHVQNSVLFK